MCSRLKAFLHERLYQKLNLTNSTRIHTHTMIPDEKLTYIGLLLLYTSLSFTDSRLHTVIDS